VPTSNDSLVNIDREITDLELDIDELNVQIEKKQIAVNSFKMARDFIKSDQGNNSDDDPESYEDENDFENDGEDQDQEQGELDLDPEEVIPDEEVKIMKGSYAWKAKEALRQSRKPMMISEIAKFCKYNKKQRETMGVIISQYERTGKIFIRIAKGLYGLKALKNKY